MTVSSKVRIYDLAKELKLDVKRLIEEVRREGVDVSVPSNSVSKELAAKIRYKYSPKEEISLKRPMRQVRVVKRADLPIREAPPVEASPMQMMPEVPLSTEIADESNGEHSEDHLLPLSIDVADDILVTVRDLVPDYAGVILTGPPGTSKTWYARQVAAALTDRDRNCVRSFSFTNLINTKILLKDLFLERTVTDFN